MHIDMQKSIIQPKPISESLLLSDKLWSSPRYFLVLYKKNNGESVIMEPIINKLANEFIGKLDFYKIDYMDSKEIRKMYKIGIAPSFILMIDGKPVDIIQGLVSYGELKVLIDGFLVL